MTKELATRTMLNLEAMDRALWVKAIEARKPFDTWPNWLNLRNFARLAILTY